MLDSASRTTEPVSGRFNYCAKWQAERVEANAIQASAAQDYQSFYHKEMAYRRERGNPPFNKLIRLLHTHINQTTCEQEARAVARTMADERDARGIGSIEILGPVPAYPARLRGRYRWHIVLRGPEPRALLDQVALPRDWHVDIDPVSLT